MIRVSRLAIALCAAVLVLPLLSGTSSAEESPLDLSREEILAGIPPNPFEDGALPFEDPWLSDARSAREAHGLPADDSTLKELMARSDAQITSGTYGVLLSDAERAFFDRRRAGQEEASRLVAEVADHPAFAGTIEDWQSTPFTVEIRVRADDFHEATRGIRSLPQAEGVDVSLRAVDYSIGDLQSYAAALRVQVGIDDEKDLDEAARERLGEAGNILRTLREATGIADATFGYSMRHNQLTVHPADGIRTDVETLELGGDLPTLRVISTKASEEHHTGHNSWPGDTPDDQSLVACGRWFCGAYKAGVFTRYDLTNNGTTNGTCTFSPGIEIRTTWNGGWFDRAVTAGHCGTTSNNEVFHLQQVNGTSLDPVIHFTPTYGGNSNSRIGSEWRNTLERSGSARGDVLLAYSNTRRNSNLMLITSTSSARVTSIKAPLGVGTQICVSLPHSNVDCDNVDDIGWTKTVEGKSVTDLAATRGGYEGEGGDSGGPIYIQGSPHIWAGAHHGSKTNWIGLTYQLFSQAHLIDDGNLGIHSFRMDPTDGRADFLQNLYMRLLNRTPDSGGWSYWYGQMSSCNATTASGVAESFLQATEFKNRFPMSGSTAHANAGMRLWYAYRTFFGRDPDPAGINFWLNDILAPSGYSEGTWDWVTTAFGDVPEFANRVNGVGTMPVDGWICV